MTHTSQYDRWLVREDQWRGNCVWCGWSGPLHRSDEEAVKDVQQHKESCVPWRASLDNPEEGK